MNYKMVDFSTWPRGDLFQFYMDHMRVVMSLTVDMDVTPLVRLVKQRGMKFYPAMIWVVSRVINAHEEFKLGWDQGGNLIRWDFVSPSYAHFHPEDGNFTKLVTPYTEDLPAFHTRFLEDREKYRGLRGVVEGQPANHFDVSCLPWVRYRHFDVHVFDRGGLSCPGGHLGQVRGGGQQTGHAADHEHPPRGGRRVSPLPVLYRGTGGDGPYGRRQSHRLRPVCRSRPWVFLDGWVK